MLDQFSLSTKAMEPIHHLLWVPDAAAHEQELRRGRGKRDRQLVTYAPHGIADELVLIDHQHRRPLAPEEVGPLCLECRHDHRGVDILRDITRDDPDVPPFLSIRIVVRTDAVSALRSDIDAGEAEAIVLAEELGADALLIDEKHGRSIAEERGIRCLGLAGALLLAKQNKLIPSLAPILKELEAKANFYLDKGLKQDLLRRAEEAAP
jgi:hypothetical protein